MNLEWASEWMHKWSFLLKYFYIANLYQECLGESFTSIFMLSFDIRIITFTLVANNLKGWKQIGLFQKEYKSAVGTAKLEFNWFFLHSRAGCWYHAFLLMLGTREKCGKWKTLLWCKGLGDERQMMWSSDTTAVSISDHTIKQEIRMQEGNFSSLPESWQRLRGNPRFWTHRGFLVCAGLVCWGLDRQING